MSFNCDFPTLQKWHLGTLHIAKHKIAQTYKHKHIKHKQLPLPETN